jgi:hypothetical protein
MARLTPGEIIESPEERESALRKQVRSLKAKLKRRDKKIKELETGKGWRHYKVGHGLNSTFTGDIECAHFEGQIENGVAIQFKDAQLKNVVFTVDHDDFLVFVKCTFKDVHFTAQPRFIFMEECTVQSKGVTTDEPENWRINNEKYGWCRTPPELLDNLQLRDSDDFEWL